MRHRRLWRLVGLAVCAPLVRAGAAGVRFAARAGLAERRGVSMFPSVPNPAPSLGLAASVALDELLLLPMGFVASTASGRHYQRSSAELDDAVRFYGERGWLNDPAGYFATPPRPGDVRITPVSRRRGPLELLRFPSGWEPHLGEPGGDRWLSLRANRDAYATVLRHEEEPRPWLVCVHGQGMGRLGDVEVFRLRHIHHELGVNVVLPVLPLHGPRRPGLRTEQQFVSNVYPMNNVLGLAQSMWDLRRILAWLREDQRASSVGVCGISLGSYAVSLLSTLDGDLACVIAVVPSGDLAEAIRTVEPRLSRTRRLAHRTVHDGRSALVHRVVSPLARPCQVPKARRFIVAGQGDQIASPPGAVLLWRHWEEPAIEWLPRGHLTTLRSRRYDDHLFGILRASGLAAGSPGALPR